MMDPVTNDFDHANDDGGTTDSAGVNTMHTMDLESGDDGVHDQLPSPEEYRSTLGNASPSRGAAPPMSPPKPTNNCSPMPESYDENTEEYVQDQLPTVEEIRAHAPRGDKSWGLLHYFAIFVGLVVVTVAIVVPVVMTNDAAPVSPASAQNGPTAAPAPKPTEPPLQRHENVMKHLVNSGISTETALMTVGTPQNKALQWIAFDDERYMDVPTVPKKHSRFNERYILAVFYYATAGPAWVYKMKFLSGDDHCEWHDDFLTNSGSVLRLGVSNCTDVPESEAESGGLMVSGISLPLNELIGSFPTEIQNLHRLETIFTPFNPQLSGNLDFGLPLLDRLVTFEAQYCAFTGTIPDLIGSLKQLTSLGLSNNQLGGSFPDSFWELTNLELLGLDDNLFEGNIAYFGQLSNLKHAYLEDNLFTGELTDGLAAAWSSRLEELDASKNLINSTLPAGFFAMQNLAVMDLHSNSLHGALPEMANPNGALLFLALYDNDLTGPIPESISNIQTLRHLDLAKNRLNSPIPDSIGQLTDLRYLFTGLNNFTRHEFPSFLWSLTLLRELSMKNNSITGTIPSEIATLNQLQLLDLDFNRLTGTIPEEIGIISGLDYLLLNRNSLSGTLPSTFALLYDLNMVLLDHNRINGTADVICENENIKLNYFTADCEGPIINIECKCCDLCCNDLNATCNDLGWNVNLDPIWEYGYTRNSYEFSTEIVANQP